MFTRAIVRIPGENFQDGLTSVGQGSLGKPDYSRALAQHTAYCQALQACSLELTILEKDLDHPDSTFVEDTAVLTRQSAILTRPGDVAREGEVARIRETILKHFQTHHEIQAPGTVDGGDICEAGDTYFIGISHRTNEAGAQQLEAFLTAEGFRCHFVDIRKLKTILHLKSGLSALENRTLVLIEELASHPAFEGYRHLVLPSQEAYAANCVQINARVFIATGFPVLDGLLRQHGYHPLALDMSEFRKMDGGLSCLSLRF